jgi:predicted flap endonuclease-1-like 5' DNA nuclease
MDKELADVKSELGAWPQREQALMAEKSALELRLEEQSALVGAPASGRVAELEAALDQADAEKRQAEQDLASFHRTAEEAEVLRRRLDACQGERKALEAEVVRLKAERGAQALSMAAPLLEGINQEGLNLSGQDTKAKDPLEKIQGIGKVFEKKLWDAGVLTFSDLASSDPNRLREIINPESWQKIEPEEWIAEARKRAGEA